MNSLHEGGYPIDYISVGEQFRRELQLGTPLGQRMNAYLQTIREYPVCLMAKLVLKSLVDSLESDVIFDGFPKYEREIKVLDQLIEDRAVIPGTVFTLTTGLDLALERAAQRYICSNCGAQTNIDSSGCSRCSIGTLEKRDDDSTNAFKRRYADYTAASQVVIPLLEKRGFDLVAIPEGTDVPNSADLILDKLSTKRPGSSEERVPKKYLGGR